MELPLPKEVKEKNAIALFSDGACRGNPGAGAWGAMGQKDDGRILFEKSGVEDSTTNNKMELTGAIMALEELVERRITEKQVILYSDSKYVVNGIADWVFKWKKKGWKKADGKTPNNLALWQKLDNLRAKFSHIHFRWVEGHSGHPQNEFVDQLANHALDEAGC